MYDERSDRARAGRRPGPGGEAPEPAIAAVTRGKRRAERAGVGEPGVVGPGVVGAGIDRAGVVVGTGAGGRPRRAHGPRPVRPAAVPVLVRPAQGERPVARVDPARRVCPNRQRTLVRRPAAVPMSTAGPGRRLLGGVLVAVLAAAVVVGLGQLLALAGAADPAPAAVGPAAVSAAGGVVTVSSEQTVWDVARRIEPAADGARQAAVAERIAVANSLTSVELRPGQVLRVPTG